MASPVWQGGAVAVAQVNTWTFASAWVIGETITVTIGVKSYVFTLQNATISTFLASLLTALQGLSKTLYPEYGEITWANPTTSTITATAATAGKPFTVTFATNSVAGTINGGVSSNGTATVASSGPNDWSTAANWSTTTVPAGADTPVIDLEGARIYWGLNQSGVTLASLRIVAQDVVIGLPKVNADNAATYEEYRPDYLKIGATSVYVRTKSGRVKLDFGAAQTAYVQDASGTGTEKNVPAVLLKGTHASNAWTINSGSAGLAFFGGETATALTLNVGASATVTSGTGVTLGTANNYGGTLNVNSAVGTALNHPGTGGGTTTVYGSGAVAQLTAQSGRVNYNSTGALGGNTVLGNDATLSFDGDSRAKAVTNPIKIYSSKATFKDSFKVITGGYTLQWLNCAPGPVGLGSNIQGVFTTL